MGGEGATEALYFIVSFLGETGGAQWTKRGGRQSYLVTLKFKVLLTLICPQN